LAAQAVVRFMAMDAPGAAPLPECCVCGGSSLPSEGLFCSPPAGQPPHFTCAECLGNDVAALAAERAAAGGAQAGRGAAGGGDDDAAAAVFGMRCRGPGAAGCRGARPFSDASLCAVLPPEPLKAAIAAQIAARQAAQARQLDAGFQGQLLPLQQRLAEAEARAGRVDELRAFVVDRLLAPACPHCHRFIGGFTGCFALQCGLLDDGRVHPELGCGTGICAWCFAECGQDAHAHVRGCEFKLSGDVYHGTEAMYQEALKRRRIRRLREYRRGLEHGLWRALRLALLRFLEDNPGGMEGVADELQQLV